MGVIGARNEGLNMGVAPSTTAGTVDHIAEFADFGIGLGNVSLMHHTPVAAVC